MSSPDDVLLIPAARKTRVWAAVLDARGEVACDVRDVEHATIETGTDAYRPWRYCVVDGPGIADDEPACRCLPGKPCRRCRAQAVKWYAEWAARTAARWFSAEKEPTPGRWSASDRCGHKHLSRLAAELCAVDRGFPRVVLRNGHGVEVSDG